MPWAGHSTLYAVPELYEIIKQHRTTLLFVNTRSQAEMLFQNLWTINEDGLAIALHHGSLAVEQRRKVESAMVAGKLQAVVCTSTLDLGIDWGDVDLVVQVGAPKGASRMLQRIGRSNHRMDEPSKAIFVPSNRFEVLECEAALEAVEKGAQDSRGSLASAGSTCWPSTRSAWPAPRRSIPSPFTRRCAAPGPIAISTGRRSSASSISSPPAATRCAPMSATPS